MNKANAGLCRCLAVAALNWPFFDAQLMRQPDAALTLLTFLYAGYLAFSMVIAIGLLLTSRPEDE